MIRVRSVLYVQHSFFPAFVSFNYMWRSGLTKLMLTCSWHKIIKSQIISYDNSIRTTYYGALSPNRKFSDYFYRIFLNTESNISENSDIRVYTLS